LRGQIGHLNIHKSGKISINLGNNNNLAVSQGSAAHFLQEVIMLEMNETDNTEDVEMMNEDGEKIKGKLYRFGQADGKIIGTPAIH
jgi:DNA-directed RNA polymerase III subunit RPC4